MSPPAVAAVIIGVTVATVLFFIYGRERPVYQQSHETHHSHSYSSVSSTRRSSYRSGNDDDCSICFNSLSSGRSVLLSCAHQFHRKCIEKWKQQSQLSPVCPLCRSPLTSSYST